MATSLALVLLALAAAGADSSELVGRVVAVADGDTLTLLVDREPYKVRLAQIDAPESGQPYGRAAKSELSKRVFGRDARVVVVDRDRYGRLVGEVFVDGEHVNQTLVRAGHAWAYTAYARSTEIVALEDEARAAGRGLWALQPDQREPPWVWRRRQRSGQQRSGPQRSGQQKDRAAEPREAQALVCGNRSTCKEMSSCEEARFHYERCGLTRLDGDRDGVPCEKLCGASR